MSDDRELCGESTENTDSCQNYADTCPWHSADDPPKTGRPTKFNDERAKQAIAAARDEGKSEAGCARAAGVHPSTIEQWQADNRTFTDENGNEREFSEAFAQARAEGESMYIEDGRREDGDTSFAKFMLSSSFKYKDAQEIEHTGPDGGPIEVNIGGDE